MQISALREAYPIMPEQNRDSYDDQGWREELITPEVPEGTVSRDDLFAKILRECMTI